MQFVLLLVCIIKSQIVLAGLRIFGGRDASEDELPYVVAKGVQAKVKHKGGEIKTYYLISCSGALLSSTWCLTAAHCIGQNFNEELKNGGEEMKHILAYRGLSKISEIIWSITYPSYKFPDHNLFAYPNDDIGLLRIEPMVLEQYAKLSALDYTILTGYEATSVGYGMNQTWNMNDILASTATLRVLKVVVIRCSKKSYNIARGLCISHMCAKFGTPCQGDSGSPLVHASGVIGVCSFGYPECGNSKNSMLDPLGISAGIYVPISPYIDWISRTITGKI